MPRAGADPDPPSGDDAGLLASLRDSDGDAFRAVFDTYADRLYRLALGMLHDPADAEDAVQETFIALAERLDQFEGRSQLGTWLYRVAYNEALQQLRRPDRRAGRRPSSLDRVEERFADDPSTGPEQRLAQREQQQAIDAALGELPETLRSAFILREIESLSTAEAAGVLEISESALKVRLHRARRAVRAALTPDELPPTTFAAGVSCETVLGQLDDYLDAALDPEVRERLERHVDLCEHCRINVDAARRTVELMGARRHWVIPAPRSSAMFERLASVFARRRPTSSRFSEP